MGVAQQKQRRRFSPEARRAMILDSAAELVAEHGVSSVTMESISQSAGSSKSLIYKYFTTPLEILRELLTRELRALRRLQFAAAEEANTFEELVRNITHEYLTYIDKRGLIIERLQADPAISETGALIDYGRTASVDYLAPIVAKHFDMPEELARAATDISFGIPASAGEYLLREEADLQKIEDLTVSMIVGTFVHVRNDFLARKQKLKR